MKPYRIVIAGGPGSGKTALISSLEEKGYACFHEISRAVTKKAQEEGVEQLFLQDPVQFSELLLKGRIEQFLEAEKRSENLVFYDRGIPDVLSYLLYINALYPSHFEKSCAQYKYDRIFLLPPWEAIYKQDSERYESFEEAQKIYQFLMKTYERYNYNLQVVPFGSIAFRTEFIIDQLSSLH